MLLATGAMTPIGSEKFAMKKGAWANIPPKSNRSEPICFSPYLYRARNRIERFFNKIKQCRRVATRCDKLAANYQAFVQLASIRLWLRANESAPQLIRPGLRTHGVIARSDNDEAIRGFASGARDCFASFAMTKRRKSCDKSTRRANQQKPVQPSYKKYSA
jgi:hypothetical protein